MLPSFDLVIIDIVLRTEIETDIILMILISDL